MVSESVLCELTSMFQAETCLKVGSGEQLWGGGHSCFDSSRRGEANRLLLLLVLDPLIPGLVGGGTSSGSLAPPSFS